MICGRPPKLLKASRGRSRCRLKISAYAPICQGRCSRNCCFQSVTSQKTNSNRVRKMVECHVVPHVRYRSRPGQHKPNQTSAPHSLRAQAGPKHCRSIGFLPRRPLPSALLRRGGRNLLPSGGALPNIWVVALRSGAVVPICSWGRDACPGQRRSTVHCVRIHCRFAVSGVQPQVRIPERIDYVDTPPTAPKSAIVVAASSPPAATPVATPVAAPAVAAAAAPTPPATRSVATAIAAKAATATAVATATATATTATTAAVGKRNCPSASKRDGKNADTGDTNQPSAIGFHGHISRVRLRPPVRLKCIWLTVAAVAAYEPLRCKR